MLLNGIDINNFRASVSSKLIQPSEIIIENEKFKLISTNISKKVFYKKIQLKILFEGSNRDIVNLNISNFMALFTDSVEIKFKNLSHYYSGYLINSDEEETGLDEWLYLNLELKVIEQGQLVEEALNRVNYKSINISGNQETPAIVEITPIVDIIDITLEGLADDPIKINNLKQNKKVILDGELQTITVDGVNKFGDTDMWDFPSLKPGSNTIKISRSDCNIKIKYKPRFI